MPKSNPPYPPEFRAEAVKLARSSEKSLSEVASDLGISTETLRNWTKQQQIDTGKRQGNTTDEQEELRRLRRENKVLKEEREVLRKATAFFAREESNTRRQR
jgi:transposase